MNSIPHLPPHRQWLVGEPGMPDDPCILHPGRVDSKGYGFWEISHNRRYAAHRKAYEDVHGPIPAGMTVDHLCFTPLCVNPNHLRLLSHRDNARRQRSAVATECSHGHPYTAQSLYWSAAGRRQCRQCRVDANRRYLLRKKQAS